MALTLTDRITSAVVSSGHGTGAYVSGSFTPANGSLLCVVVQAMDTTGASMTGADLTITDSLGSTWTPVGNTGTPPTWAYGIRAWTTPITTGASMTVTIDCGGYDIRNYVLYVFDVTGYDTGTPVAGFIAGTDADGDGAGALTLSATPTADDIAIAATIVQTGGTGAITHGTGWTEKYETGEADWCRAQFQIRTGSTSTSVGWDDLSTAGSPFDAVMLAFIVKNASGPAAEVDQDAFRFYNDNGSETAATAAQAQDTNESVALDTARTIRFRAQSTGDFASTAFKLKAQKNGSGGYTDVPVGLPASPSVSWGAIGTGGAGTNSCTPTYPTGISASTSELFCCVTGRSNTASTAFSAPSGWTLVSSSELEGGTGTFAADTGTRRVAWFKKDTVSGSETGTETFAYASGSSGNSTIYASIVRVEKPIGHSISVAATTGADTTNGTGYSATGSAGLSFLADDLLLIGTAQNIDTGTQSSEAITATDVTFGTLSNRRSTAVTNGFDQRHIIVSRPVTSVTGTPTSAPTYSYTISASGSGPTSFLRLRSVAPTVELYVATSSNITAGGEATTNRLSGGSGSFVTGRIWDDENGTDLIDITTNNYTELAWNLKIASGSNSDYWDLRVYAGDTVFAGYTQTPRLTLSTGSGGVNTRTSTDTISATDAPVRIILRPRTSSDSLLLTDPSTRSRGAEVTNTETFDVVDGTLARLIRNRMIGDAVVVLDLFSKSVTGSGTINSKVATDELVVADISWRTLRRNRESADVTALADATIRTVYRVRGFDEQIALIDTFTKVVTSTAVNVRVISEGIVVADASAAVLLRFRAISDILTIVDASHRARIASFISSDTLVVSDGVDRRVLNGRVMTDTVGVADSSLRRLLLNRVTGEGVTLLDFFTAQLSSSGAVNTRVSTNVVEFTDPILRTVSRHRWVNDAIALTDDFIKSVRATVAVIVTDGITVIDAVLVRKHLTRRPEETLAVTDSFLRTIYAAITYDVRVIISTSEQDDYSNAELGAYDSHAGISLGAEDNLGSID